MQNIFSAQWKYGNKLMYIALTLSFLIISYYHLRSGFAMSSDSERFSRWADDLIKLNFNLYDFFSIDKISIRPPLFFFSIPVILIAICKVIFANEWQFAFLILNLTLVFFSLIIFVRSLSLIEVRPILISLTLPLIALSVDILIWPKFILSDMIYAFLVLLATYFVLKSIVKNKIYFFKICSIIFLLLASRPSSIPIIFSIIFFIIILKYKILSNPKIIILFLLTLFISTPFFYALLYFLMEINFNGIAKVDFLVNMVKEGMIIHDRPETWVDKPNNFIDVVYIYFLRLLNFFNPYASTFSIIHIALNIFPIFLTLLSICLWLFFGNYLEIQNKTFLFILLLSFSVAAFHSFILIDYDWRYRFPIVLPLLMLTPITLEIILKKMKFN